MDITEEFCSLLSHLHIVEWAVMSDQTDFYSYTNRTVTQTKTRTKFNFNTQTNQHQQQTIQMQTISLSCKSPPQSRASHSIAFSAKVTAEIVRAFWCSLSKCNLEVANGN